MRPAPTSIPEVADPSTEEGRATIRAAADAGRLINIHGDNIEEIRSQLHETPIAGAVYQELIRDIHTGLIEKTAIQYAGDLIARLKPRNALERMLITHALWTHGRLFKLNMMLAKTDRVNDVRILSELVDRAASAFRKDVTALAEYRRPRRTVKITGQINAAQQQVVQNNGGRNDMRRVTSRSPKALPAASDQSSGPQGTTGRDSKASAVAKKHRAANGRR